MEKADKMANAADELLVAVVELRVAAWALVEDVRACASACALGRLMSRGMRPHGSEVWSLKTEA
jgi:hypothetical protein